MNDYEVKILVFRFDSQGKRKELFRSVVIVTDGDPVNYTEFISVFRRLYPLSFIEFVIQI